MRLLFVAFLTLFVAGPVYGQARPPITVKQGLELLRALRALDGRSVVVKDETVVVPWEFGSGVLRLRIAKNIALMAENEKTAEEARLALIKEFLRRSPPGPDGQPPTAIPPGPDYDEFIRLFTAMLEEPARGGDQLVRIKVAELRLDKNEIPVTVLTALIPILDE